MIQDKISLLIRQNQKLFRSSDLKTIWGISNSNTLYKTIDRLTKKQVLIPLQKGFYSIIPIDQLDPILIGFRGINHFNYLSTESILSLNGIINQSPSKFTFISKKSRTFTVNLNTYLVRQLKPSSLNNPLGITQNSDGVFVANTERAVADMLYFQKNYHFDADNFINWTLVKSYQKKLGYL